MTPIDLASPALTKTILRSALPAVGGLSINAVHQAVDTYFVGQLGPEAVAAVSLILPLVGVHAAIGIGLGIGTATSIGRALGAGQKPLAGQVASAAMSICLMLAALISVVIWTNQTSLAEFLGAWGAVKAPALSYLNLLAISAGLGMVQILCDFLAIGEGNSRFSLMTLIVCFSLNMCLDPVLIFWAGLGVQGAALATVLAQLVTLAIYLLYFWRGHGALRLRPSLNLKALIRIRPVFMIGMPEAIAVLLSSLSFVLIYRLAGVFEGSSGQAGMGIGLRLWLLASLPVQGFCLGAQAVLSHATGASDVHRLKRATHIITLIALGAGCFVMVIGLIFSREMAQVFTSDWRAVGFATSSISALALTLPAVAIRQSTLILLQATARARTAALLSLLPICALFLPLMTPALQNWGFAGLTLYLPLSQLISGIVAAAVLWRMPSLLPKGSIA